MAAEVVWWALALLVPASLPGVLTGYCARSHGRSFWLWFALGALAPGVSLFGLMALLARKELHPGAPLLAEAQGILAAVEAQEQALVELAYTLLRQAETNAASRYQEAERLANAPALCASPQSEPAQR